MKLPHIRAQWRVSRSFSRRSPVLLVLYAFGMGIILLSLLVNWPGRGVPGAHAHSAAPQKGKAGLGVAVPRAGTVPAPASIDTLSAQLSSYLAPLGSKAGVEVYDVTHQRSYSYNGTTQFLTASSIKVPIMLTFFAMTESQGREPNADEMNLLTAMIEQSDNDSASTLFSAIGRASGTANYLQQIGVNGLVPDDNAWGYSQVTPQAMVTLLTKLHDGAILSAPDRATALGLMQQVEADQQWGVGTSAPSRASFAMKNGWVPGPDGLWSVNTSGIVNAGSETYIISVYTQEQQSLADGQAIVQQVCGAVASALV